MVSRISASIKLVSLSFSFSYVVMDCNKENSVVLCLLYFSFRIIMGLLVMKVAPGVPVFSTIWRALGLDCCDMGWESPFEPDQDNACEGSVHFYFHVSQDTPNPQPFGNRGIVFSWMSGAHQLDMHFSYLGGYMVMYMISWTCLRIGIFPGENLRYLSWHTCNLVMCVINSQTSVCLLHLAKHSPCPI